MSAKRSIAIPSTVSSSALWTLAPAAFDDLDVAQHRLELADPRLVEALLVLRGVVVGVLLEVAELTRPLDPLGDLTAERPAAVLELGQEPFVRGDRELRGVRGFHRARVPVPVRLKPPE